MQINRISFTPLYRKLNNTNKYYNNRNVNTPPENKEPSKSLTAYQDYNVNFGARLFRTPANFYAQKFNEDNMPLTMKNYLNTDFDDLQNMPPEQLMREAFIDLKDIDSLDLVSQTPSLKDEPLFKELTDTPNRKAMKGLVSEIEALKDIMDEIPLFKDGSSNFGMYVLKKIYLEGKTLKEINKDFREDLSDDYKGLISSPIDSYAIKAYGIKYPNSPFWNSFYPTRKEFPYEYKPRKVNPNSLRHDKAERSISDILASKDVMDTRPPKFKIDKSYKFKGKKMGEALIQGHGDIQQTERALRKRGINNSEELSFVSKYLGPIMSISLEKIHASEEMHSYFENYDSLNKSQKEKLDSYWRKNNHMRELQSIAISDTIKLFYEAYGADGNNEVFKELLEYADSIKPKREQAKLEHQQKQLELEETFAKYPEETEIETQQTGDKNSLEDLIVSKEELETKAAEEARKCGGEVFTFMAPTGDTVKYVGNVEELYRDQITREFGLFPKNLLNKYINYSLKSPDSTYEYKKATGLIFNVPDFVADQLLPPEDIRRISSKINTAFLKKYPTAILAGEQALAEVLMQYDDNTNLMSFNAMQLAKLAVGKYHHQEWSEDDRLKLEKAYEKYSAPITSKEEIRQLNKAVINYLTCTDPDNSDWDNFGDLDEIYALIAKTLITYPQEKNKLEKYMKEMNIIKNYGGSARVLLDPDVSPKIKNAKAKLIYNYMLTNTKDANFLNILSKDADYINKYVDNDENRDLLLQRHIWVKSKNK